MLLVTEHESVLFSGSLRDNIEFGVAYSDRVDEHALAAAVARAAHSAAADQVAEGTALGMAEPVTERGASLSGGQHQRIALARVLAADPPVLVLDDPTTAVDAVTEATIAGRLARLRRGRGTVLITTSPALLAAADRVVVLEGGTVTLRGRHHTLSSGSDRYRELVLP